MRAIMAIISYRGKKLFAIVALRVENAWDWTEKKATMPDILLEFSIYLSPYSFQSEYETASTMQCFNIFFSFCEIVKFSWKEGVRGK